MTSLVILLCTKDGDTIRLDITPSGNTNEGRLRLDFKNTGTYWMRQYNFASGSEGNEWNEWIVAESGGDFNNSITVATKKQQQLQTWRHNFIKNGTYRNSNWDGDDEFNEAGNNWVSEQHNDNGTYTSIGSYNSDNWLASKNGSVDRPIVIRNYIDGSGNHHTPLIQFDGGSGLIFGQNSPTGNGETLWTVQHLEIAGLKVQGASANISYKSAKKNRDTMVQAIYASDPPNPNVKSNSYESGGPQKIFILEQV